VPLLGYLTAQIGRLPVGALAPVALLGDAATTRKLLEMAGAEQPALTFTCTHGIEFRPTLGDPCIRLFSGPEATSRLVLLGRPRTPAPLLLGLLHDPSGTVSREHAEFVRVEVDGELPDQHSARSGAAEA
jgi:hypothetical protein